ncbi:MAG: carnitine dehydratase [Betaproteobacteria bacterium RIFCSPHIGHO2_12_FULL_69_13]|nr:MAG: carnitine dehydratase [Betaproteobacteria bacterium RIFCSPHIGHO2_12_FULL_69_13]OGA65387.1 MAG: carnitine dehydratase [Betaproteobacteria bacterium RIFCSPLOWO2_12_FULL_68_20]
MVKIEKPGGDDARTWGPPFVDGGGPSFVAVNRGKRSAVCELRDAAQRGALVRYIVARADVVLQAMRPGQVEALGLDAAALRARKPSLVYCNMGAFGARGPLAARPGYDALMQAFAGIMSVTGEEGRPPVRVGPSLVDMGSSLWAVIGILAALGRRRDTGEGAVVDVSLFETAAAWMGPYAVQYLASGEVPKRGGSGRVEIVPYQAYPAADGDFVIGAANDALFRKLCGALGHPEWAEDPRFRSNADRVKSHGALDALIEAETRKRSRAEWGAALEAAGVPCAPVQNVRELLEHEQLRALGMLQAVPGSSVPLIGLPISFDGERPAPRSGPPALGEYTDKVLAA